MTTIQIDPLGTTVSLLTSSTAQHVVKDENHVSTTVTGLSTTLSLSMTRQQIHLNATNQYVDSLSDQELVELIVRLDAKENEMMTFTQESVEKPKVYQKL